MGIFSDFIGVSHSILDVENIHVIREVGLCGEEGCTNCGDTITYVVTITTQECEHGPQQQIRLIMEADMWMRLAKTVMDIGTEVDTELLVSTLDEAAAHDKFHGQGHHHES